MTVNGKTILITGGTGSLGKALTKTLLTKYHAKAIRIYSRDELKQWQMGEELKKYPNFGTLRFFIGDVRDGERLRRSLENVDVVIHAAALKQIPAAEYNPMECIKTNILGAQNLIGGSLDNNVKKVIAISTDKAVAPANLYGATKLCSEKLFTAANNMRGGNPITFSIVRYGNVLGSRGSVVPFFLENKESGVIPITHPDMTRFNITLNEAVELILFALKYSVGGEIFIPKLSSYKIVDLAKAIAPKCRVKIVGIRPGEKLHEEMVAEHESYNTVELKNHYIIFPNAPTFGTRPTIEDVIKKFKGKKVKDGFKYNSGDNTKWLSVNDLRNLIKKNIDPNFNYQN